MNTSGEIQMPLSSSHYYNGKVRTCGVVITPFSCSVVHDELMPKLGSTFGAEHIALVQARRVKRKGALEKQRKVAEQIVIRAREGDQNAMAIMALARDNAKKGNKRAATACTFMTDYVQKNPVTSNFGDEPAVNVKPDMFASSMLANGKPLSKPRITRVAKALPDAQKFKLFVLGFQKWQSEHEKDHQKIAARLNSLQQEVLRLGRTLGQARALQALRNGAPISTFSSDVAWELGE